MSNDRATSTTIVATLGPASDSPAMIRTLLEAGVDVVRINFSHGRHDDHRRMAHAVRSAAADLRREVALLGDIAGPKIRCGRLADEPVHLAAGQIVSLTPENIEGSGSLIPILYPPLLDELAVGQEIALDDGRIRLSVDAIEAKTVRCRVVEGGPLHSGKGVNLPDTELSVAAITDADRDSIALAAEEGFDFLGLSFVKSSDDVEEARSICRDRDADLALIAKIERRAAVDRLDEILDAADGAMVARGDLGVELPIERVPLVQKRVIRACNERAKPVITATQMLESMIRNRRPTRAEVTDIANAILDGTDAVMLSGETAIGDYPAQAVRAMDRVARTTDDALDRASIRSRWAAVKFEDEDSAMAHAAAQMAADLDLAAIVCLTEGGSTARRISRHRPHCPVLAMSNNRTTIRRLLMSWGVKPVYLSCAEEPSTDSATSDAPSGNLEQWTEWALGACTRSEFLRPGRRVAIVAGLPLGRPGITNVIHLATVPE
jgi:pyruvate kinase